VHINTKVVSSTPTHGEVHLETTLCDKVSSTNKTDRHDKTKILLKATLNRITLTLYNNIEGQTKTNKQSNIYIINI